MISRISSGISVLSINSVHSLTQKGAQRKKEHLAEKERVVKVNSKLHNSRSNNSINLPLQWVCLLWFLKDQCRHLQDYMMQSAPVISQQQATAVQQQNSYMIQPAASSSHKSATTYAKRSNIRRRTLGSRQRPVHVRMKLKDVRRSRQNIRRSLCGYS